MAQTIIPADTNGIRDKAAIVGIGETEFSWNSGRSELQLASEAIKAACDDAGIAPQDIDGLVRYDMESNHETLLTQSLGIKNLRHWESVSYGGEPATPWWAMPPPPSPPDSPTTWFASAPPTCVPGCGWAAPEGRSGF